jgi:hypothetical protein
MLTSEGRKSSRCDEREGRRGRSVQREGMEEYYGAKADRLTLLVR